MDKFFKTAKDFETTKKLLEAINRTTDDFLFVFDIPHNENWFFGPIDDEFEVRTPGSAVNTFEQMLDIVHPADRKELCDDIDRIKNGKQDVHDMNYRWFNRRGETVWINCRGNVIHDENGSPIIMIGRVSREALAHLYNHLTGRWNKVKLREDLKERLNGPQGVLMLIDITGLADINLSHGRSFGDRLLCEIADVLEQCEDVERCYHVDHNNFAVFVRGTSQDRIRKIYEQLTEAMNGKCSFSAGAVPIDRSIFIDAAQLLDSINVTLHKAKAKVNEKLEFFSADEIEHRISSLILLEELKESVQNDFEGFEVVYQPQVKGGSYEIYGVEALLRYNSQNRGRVFPDVFIPILEQSRLIESVGLWVLEEALRQCKEWRKIIPSLRISVNFSTVQFEDRKLGEKIIDALKKAELPGDALTVELTESIQLHQNEHFHNIIKYIKAYGVRFAIDDFGTGYSNLGYLKHLNADEIKIDRSFVTEIEKNSYNYRLVSNVIEFAKVNLISACCEGVETNKELSVLESLQPDYIQGYLFDKPCSADEITRKYILASSEEYKARAEHIESIYKYKEQNGIVHFDPKNILRENNVGLWVIRIDEKKNHYEMYADETMERILGLEQKCSPQECYRYWYERIRPDNVDYVNYSVGVMIRERKSVQLKYIWKHPMLGDVTVRCSGIRTRDADGMTVIEGYHRILSDVEGE